MDVCPQASPLQEEFESESGIKDSEGLLSLVVMPAMPARAVYFPIGKAIVNKCVPTRLTVKPLRTDFELDCCSVSDRLVHVLFTLLA